ncbi:MAG: ABC transporter permease [Synergistaceae bacterium]|jgi:simple sugar transport system permease protein|nr:ABC transporter permease [Synergistaceae bacterium]
MEWSELIPGLVAAAVPMAVPLLLVGLGEMFDQRAGMFNLGAEGIMMMGAFVAFFIDLKLQMPWVGLLAALVVGGIFGLLMGLVCATFRSKQGIAGIGIYMLGWGLSGTLFRVYVGGPMPIHGIPALNLSFLQGIPYIGHVLATLNPMDYVTFFLIPLSGWLLFKTAWGLKVRAVGTTPRAADTLGIDVIRIRYQCIILAGAMAGLAGAYLSVCQAKIFADNITAGRGFIAVALVYFGRWSPWGVAAGAAIFSLAAAAQRLIQFYGFKFPYELALIIPYVLVIVVLACSRNRNRVEPAALGKPYFREYRG